MARGGGATLEEAAKKYNLPVAKFAAVLPLTVLLIVLSPTIQIDVLKHADAATLATTLQQVLSARLLVRLADGQEVESVLLLRDGVCVSTQVGCAVGCVFCMTGKSGLIRQLTDMEIVAQVALARRMRG